MFELILLHTTKLTAFAALNYWFFYVISDECSLNNGGCSHQCSVVPGGRIVCSCPAGFNLTADNKTCEIMDYCTKHLKCSQVCEQHKNTVKCSCYEGWKLSKDGESCVSTGKLKFCACLIFRMLMAVMAIYWEPLSLFYFFSLWKTHGIVQMWNDCNLRIH